MTLVVIFNVARFPKIVTLDQAKPYFLDDYNENFKNS